MHSGIRTRRPVLPPAGRAGPLLGLCLLVWVWPGCSGGSLTGSGAKGPEVDGKAALDHVAKLVSFGPRPPGSEALRAAGDYIIERLTAHDIEVRTDEWEESGLAFRNIWGVIPGPRPDIVMLAAHYDTKLYEGHDDPAYNFRFVGANDGGSAPGLLLELAPRIRDMADRQATVWIVFFDGEESLDPTRWDEDLSLFGSRRMAGHFRGEWADERRLLRCMILLDMVGAKDLKLDYDLNSNPRLIQIFHDAAQDLGLRHIFLGRETAYEIIDDHIPFQRMGVPVINLIDLKDRHPIGDEPDPSRWWHTELDDMPILSASSLEKVGRIVLHALPVVQERFLPPR